VSQCVGGGGGGSGGGGGFCFSTQNSYCDVSLQLRMQNSYWGCSAFIVHFSHFDRTISGPARLAVQYPHFSRFFCLNMRY